MGNPHRGETTFTAGERQYRVRFTWNAAAEFEDTAGRALSDALQDVARGRLSAKSLRAMLWAGLQEHQPNVTLQEAGRLIEVLGRREAQRVMRVALQYFFPELKGDDEDPGPPPPAASA